MYPPFLLKGEGDEDKFRGPEDGVDKSFRPRAEGGDRRSPAVSAARCGKPATRCEAGAPDGAPGHAPSQERGEHGLKSGGRSRVYTA